MKVLIWSLLLAAFAGAQAPHNYRYFETVTRPGVAVYDGVRNRFLISVPETNQIFVVTPDGNEVARIPVFSPYALDLSPDSSRLYVGSGRGYKLAVDGIQVFDAATLKPIDFLRVQNTVSVDPIMPTPQDAAYPREIAVSKNGAIFYAGARRDTCCGDMLTRLDPVTGWIRREIPLPENYVAGVGQLRKSGDGSKIIAFGGGATMVYNVATDRFHIPSGKQIGTQAALNRDGSRILAETAQLWDGDLNLIAELSPNPAAHGSIGGAAFSPDGTRIYALGMAQDPGLRGANSPAVFVYDAANGAHLGVVPAPAYDTNQVMAAAQDRVLILEEHGFSLLDVSQRETVRTGPYFQAISNIEPPMGDSAATADVFVRGSGFRQGARVFFGSNEATVRTLGENTMVVRPPPGTGVVDITVSFPGGWGLYLGGGYAYGPKVTYQSVHVGGTDGGTEVELVGYGLATSNMKPEVRVGGVSVGDVAVKIAPVVKNGGRMQSIRFRTPPGTGDADIEVRNDYGSTKLTKAFRYVSQRTIGNIIPMAMVFDGRRNLLYAADYVTGNVVAMNPDTGSTGILYSSQAGADATHLALTPDGTTLIVLSSLTQQVILYDLQAGRVKSTFRPLRGEERDRIVLTAVAATARGSILLGGRLPGTSPGGRIYEVDLTGKDAVQLRMLPSVWEQQMFASTEDGKSIVFGAIAQGFASNLPAQKWEVSLGTVSASGFETEFGLSITPSGHRILADFESVLDPEFRQIATIVPNRHPLGLPAPGIVLGGELHSQGGLTFVPTESTVEIYDVWRGQLKYTVGVQGEVLPTLDSLIADREGRRIFVAQYDGVGVIDLETAPLSIGDWSPDVAGTMATLTGSGFGSGTTVTVDGKLVAAQVVDSTNMRLLMPAAADPKGAITVGNPDGSTYTSPLAFDLAPPRAAVASVNSVTRKNTVLMIYGGGFIPGVRVLFNGTPLHTEFGDQGTLKAYLSYVGGRLPSGSYAIQALNPGAIASNTVVLHVPPLIIGGLTSGVGGTALSPGGSATLYWEELTAWYTSMPPPYPTIYDGIAVKINGVPAPISYVSPTQVNFFVPWQTASGEAQVVVRLGENRSVPLKVSVRALAPEIYRVGTTSQGAVLIAGTDKVAGDPGYFWARPVARGQYIEIYASGLGPVDGPVADGQVPSGLRRVTQMPRVFFDCPSGQCEGLVSFAGLAPGFPALHQVNVRVPETVSPGLAVPLRIVSGGVTSNVVTIAVE